MKDSLLRILTDNGYSPLEDTCLLAVSGGLDSMVLAELFRESGLRFSIAHVNHGLRGQESDEDEAFVQNWAQTHSIPFYSLKIDLDKASRDSGLGYQEVGRNIRYKWFEELCLEHACRFLVTAHHADDRAETVLHRIVRGTGIAGLGGIPEQRGKVLRPLLAHTKKELMEYARSRSLSWREDSSNDSENYTRNQIRLSILPALERINPSVRQSLLALAEEATEAFAFLSDQAEVFWQDRTSLFCGAYAIRKFRVQPKGHQALLLCLALRKRGFYPLKSAQLIELMNGLPGKYLQSDQLRLYNDRDSLFLVNHRTYSPEDSVLAISEAFRELPEGWSHEMLEGPPRDFGSGSCGYFDFEKLRFPLILRKWRQGDRIRPFGMSGSMKVSDILTQAKMPLFLKDRQRVLTSGEVIVWVPGFRVSAEMCVKPETQRIVKICFPGL